MTRVVFWVTIGLVLVVLPCMVSAQTESSINKENKFDDTDEVDEGSNRAAKLVAYHTTKTKAVFDTTTSFALSTCYSVTNMPACTGRKKRNIMVNPDALEQGVGTSLSGSLDDALRADDLKENHPREDRKFTFWNTVFSTYTLTSIFYFPGTTVTVSAICSAPGLANSCFG